MFNSRGLIWSAKRKSSGLVQLVGVVHYNAKSEQSAKKVLTRFTPTCVCGRGNYEHFASAGLKAIYKSSSRPMPTPIAFYNIEYTI